MMLEKRRIFMVNQGDDSQKFGVGKYIFEMTNEVAKENYHMIVITIGAEALFNIQITKKRNITFLNIPKPFLKKDESIYGLSKLESHGVFLILIDLFKISENDIFHFNSNMQHFLLRKIKKLTPAKIVYTVHVSMWNVFYNNNEEDFLSEWNDSNCFSIRKKNILAEIKSCKLADRVIGLSNNTFNDLTKYYKIPTGKLKRIYNGISTTLPLTNKKKMNIILKHLEISPEDLVFLFVGRLNEQKGISDLVVAFEALIESGHNNLKLVIAGDGPLKDKLAAQTKKLKGSIFFLGYIPQDHIHYYYELADAIVIPSLYDQNPYTVLEAMAYQVPMIVTEIDAFKALTGDFICLKVPLESETKVDISKLKKSMKLLIESPEVKESLVENARSMLLKNFNVNKMFHDTYNF